MDIENKVLVLPNICGIEIDASALATPSVNPSLQPFYNTIVQDSTPKVAYTSPGKVAFSEQGQTTRAGLSFKQTLTLEFPSNDPLRVQRFKDYFKVKYIYIKLSTGMVLFFGRNDYYQNAAPRITSVSNEKTTRISYTTNAMFSAGFTNGSFDFELPEDVPINFYNL